MAVRAEIEQRSKLANAPLAVAQPGTTMVITDKPVNGDTQSKPGFKILGLGEVAQR